jgi:hypothetical protein
MADMTTTTLTPKAGTKSAAKNRTRRTLGLTTAFIAAVAAIGMAGSYGSWTTSSTKVQTATAAIIDLTSPNTTFTTALASLVPGDSGIRFVELRNNGNVASNLTATVAATGTTGGTGATNSDVNGAVRVTVDYCTGTYAWNAGSPTCSGGTWSNIGAAWNSAQVSTLGTSTNMNVVSGSSNTLAANTTYGLRVTYAVDSNASQNLAGASSSLAWGFTLTQRTGTALN